MNKIKVGLHALGGIAVTALGVASSPAFLALLPAKYAGIVALAGAVYAAQSQKAVQTTPSEQTK